MSKISNRLKNRGIGARLLVSFLCVCILISSNTVSLKAASGVKIRYNKKTITYTEKQLAVTVDGSKINLAGTHGIAVKSSKKETIYMLPAYEVYRKGIGASYSVKSGKITISKWGTTIKMTVGSKTAYVNGKKKTLDYAPTYVKFYQSGKTKLLVPSKFVTETLGYYYSSVSTSSTVSTVRIVSPMMLKYDGKWIKYTGTQAKFSFDGSNIDVTEMPCVNIGGSFYVQAKKFADNKIGGSYGYNSTSKTITLKYDKNIAKMTVGSKEATVNGEKVFISVPARCVVNSKNGKTYVMVPLTFTASKLGLEYGYNKANRTCEVSRGDVGYFHWTELVDNSTGTEGEYIISEALGERQMESDVFTLWGDFPKGNVSTNTKQNTLTITLTNTKNLIGQQNTALSNPFLLASAQITTDESGITTITLKKVNSKSTFSIEIQDGFVQVNIEKVSYVIAIDAGHGDYTVGKRTPKLPYDLDFDSDGVIDAAKGTQIREHTANVGVSKYLSQALKRCGFTVYESAFGSEDISLSSRQANIKSVSADYSISVHFNAAGTGSTFNDANGIEVFYHSDSAKRGDSKNMASAILKEVAKGTPQKNRGINGGSAFAMCNTIAMNTKASILLECAFMTNLHEATTMMANTVYWKETAEETAKGLCNYLGVTYVAG